MEGNSILEEVSFQFNARFSQLIGRHLISNPIVAVSELVKNSYDADADNITLEFSNLKKETPTLRIIDDGDGMSQKDIKTKWMVVGTDNKVRESMSKKQRRKLGEKGIGRFSVERLAKKTTIKTTQFGEDFMLVLTIDWDIYENTDVNFTDIKHYITSIPCEKERKGTEVILEDLRDEWNEHNLAGLRKELNLIRPIDINQVSYKEYKFAGDDINIELISLDYPTKSGAINAAFMNYSQAHLYGEINEDGSAFISVNIKSNISMSKTELKSELTFKPGELNTSCGPISCEVFVFFKDKRLYKSMDINKKDFDDILAQFSGVKIYRDGFRILPFGDTNNDWLELNAKRTSSPEHRIATGNTIGLVYITRDNNQGLQDVLNRENMYATPEFESLKDFVNRVFYQYTSLQLDARKKQEKKKTEEGKAALNEAGKHVKNFAKQVDVLQKKLFEFKEEKDVQQRAEKVVAIGNDLSSLMSTVENSLNTVKLAYNYYRKQDDFKSREMQIYRNIATLGISAAMFGHEAIKQTVDAKVHCDELEEDFEIITKDLIRLKDLFNKLHMDIRLIDEKADFFRSYLQREKQDRARYVNVKKSFETVIKQHKNAFNSINVNIEVDIVASDEQLITWGYEGDFDSIFTNLITNAYKALRARSEIEKKMRFEITSTDGNIIIETANTGQPIEMKDREHIFEPLFSTYSDGTGLGLTIIQDTLSNYQGNITLCEDYPMTRFKLTMPKYFEPETER
ncbi:sensory histidine kinase AtoS [compost metagenome]